MGGERDELIDAQEPDDGHEQHERGEPPRFAGFWLRHQRIGTRSTSDLFPARALAFWAINFSRQAWRGAASRGSLLAVRRISGYITGEGAETTDGQY